jgi:drug/metabolite transporter (DMT)-like permease
LGFTTLQEAYIALADGVLDAEHIYFTLFGKPTANGSSETREPTIVRFNVDEPPVNGTPHALLALQEQFPGTLKWVSFDYEKLSKMATVQSCFSLTSMERISMVKTLERMAAMGIRVETKSERRTRILLSILLMLLWGLDPVFAKIILMHGVSPASFTALRLMSVFCFSAVVWSFTVRQGFFSRLSLRIPSLWFAGIALFFVSLLTYPALLSGSPELYNTVIRGNAFLIAITTLRFTRSKAQLLTASALILSGGAWLVFHENFSRALMLSLGVLGCFYIYTRASTDFQRAAKVLARQSQFFFFSSAIALLCTFLFLPFLSISLPSPFMSVVVIMYAMIFVGLPYVAFYNLTRRHGYATISQAISLSVIVTFVAEAFLNGLSSFLWLLPPAMLITAGSFMSSRVLHNESTEVQLH